jgi:hypothetical protein
MRIQGRERDEKLAHAKYMEEQLQEVLSSQAKRPQETFEAHSEMPEKQHMDFGRALQEQSDPPQTRRRRGEAASSSACTAASDAGDRGGEGIAPSAEPEPSRPAEPTRGGPPEWDTKSFCPRCMNYFDKSVGTRGRVGGKQKIWIATKAGERYHVCQECKKLQCADPRFVKEYTGCYDCAFPRHQA